MQISYSHISVRIICNFKIFNVCMVILIEMSNYVQLNYISSKKTFESKDTCDNLEISSKIT